MTSASEPQNAHSTASEWRLSRATTKRLALGLSAAACFTLAGIETHEPNLDHIPTEHVREYGPESYDPVDTTLKSIGLLCLVGVGNVKRSQ